MIWPSLVDWLRDHDDMVPLTYANEHGPVDSYLSESANRSYGAIVTEKSKVYLPL